MQDIKKYQIITEKDLGVCNIESKLCVIVAGFDTEPKQISRLVDSYPDVQFWLAAKSMTREEILFANKIGIRNVISYPIDESIIETYIEAQNTVVKPEEPEEVLLPLNNPRVMVVDDNIMNVQLLEEVTNGLGITLEVFTQPRNTFGRISEEKFDLFLLDILMPDISGFEIAEHIRNSDINKDSPIIFISALSDYEYKISGYDAGACNYIEKPYDVEIVRRQIYNVLRQEEAKKEFNKSKDAFLAMVTHDLKTPISAEIRALQLLLKNKLGTLSVQQQEILGDILSSVKFMKTMTDNILCSYKHENSGLDLRLELQDLVSVINISIDETKYLLVDKGLKLNFYHELKTAPAKIDSIEIKRVVNNLIGNAVDYAPAGSGIDIRLSKSDKAFAVSVTDYGCGIKLDDPNEIFENNLTLAKENKRIGFGLGLFISKNIVNAHGGRIWAESKVGEGTTITFTVPE